MKRFRMRALLGAALAMGALALIGSTAAARDGVDDSRGASAGDSRSLSSSDRADRREIRRAGRCSASSRWKFKVKNEDGNRLEVEFEVDQNRNGQRWGVQLKQNGRKVLRRAYRTRPPSGSFEARRIIRNRPDRDRLVATARNTRTGERCTARIVF